MSHLRRELRIGILIAGGHFLLTALLWGVMMVVTREAPKYATAGPLLVIAVLLAPIALLAPLARGAGLAFFFPPAAALPAAFASVVWAVVLYVLLFFLRRFVRYRPSVRTQRLSRRLAMGFAAVAISWLFFGPVFGFAGDTMIGVLDPARIMDGRFQYRPVWVAISVLAWAAALFAAYRVLITGPSTRETGGR